MSTHKYSTLLVLFFLVLVSCQNEEDKAWQQTLSLNSTEAIDSFLLVYPSSKYAADAAVVKEDFSWFSAKQKGTVYHFKKYLVDFPNGKYKDEVANKIDSIDSGPINLSELTKSTFVGKIDYGNRETQVLAFRFAEIVEDSTGINFWARINTSDIQKRIEGRIELNNFVIMFSEAPTDQFMLNITDGRAYMQGNKIILESTNVNQYWNLIKYNEE